MRRYRAAGSGAVKGMPVRCRTFSVCVKRQAGFLHLQAGMPGPGSRRPFFFPGGADVLRHIGERPDLVRHGLGTLAVDDHGQQAALVDGAAPPAA